MSYYQSYAQCAFENLQKMYKRYGLPKKRADKVLQKFRKGKHLGRLLVEEVDRIMHSADEHQIETIHDVNEFIRVFQTCLNTQQTPHPETASIAPDMYHTIEYEWGRKTKKQCPSAEEVFGYITNVELAIDIFFEQQIKKALEAQKDFLERMREYENEITMKGVIKKLLGDHDENIRDLEELRRVSKYMFGSIVQYEPWTLLRKDIKKSASIAIMCTRMAHYEQQLEPFYWLPFESGEVSKFGGWKTNSVRTAAHGCFWSWFHQNGDAGLYQLAKASKSRDMTHILLSPMSDFPHTYETIAHVQHILPHLFGRIQMFVKTMPMTYEQLQKKIYNADRKNDTQIMQKIIHSFLSNLYSEEHTNDVMMIVVAAVNFAPRKIFDGKSSAEMRLNDSGEITPISEGEFDTAVMYTDVPTDQLEKKKIWHPEFGLVDVYDKKDDANNSTKI